MKTIRQKGFTLIEVAIALGIIAFALVALLGMLPVGLTTFHDAKRNTVDARIIQQLTAMLQLSDWSSPSGTNTSESPEAGYIGTEYYFDSYGNQLGTSRNLPKDLNQIVYTAQISVNGGSASARNVTLPGASGASPFLASFTVLITDLPAGASDRFSYSTYPQLKRGQNTLLYSVLIAQTSGA